MTIGHNSKHDEKVTQIMNDYSASLARSAEENDIRTDLRNQVKDMGLDTKALQNAISWAKASLKQRDGYDESLEYFKKMVADEGGAETLFKWVIDKEEDKRKAKEAKKAKADEYKPAPERKAKEAKSIGVQQAEAIQKGKAA